MVGKPIRSLVVRPEPSAGYFITADAAHGGRAGQSAHANVPPPEEPLWTMPHVGNPLGAAGPGIHSCERRAPGSRRGTAAAVAYQASLRRRRRWMPLKDCGVFPRPRP